MSRGTPPPLPRPFVCGIPPRQSWPKTALLERCFQPRSHHPRSRASLSLLTHARAIQVASTVLGSLKAPNGASLCHFGSFLPFLFQGGRHVLPSLSLSLLKDGGNGPKLGTDKESPMWLPGVHFQSRFPRCKFHQVRVPPSL